MSEHDFRKEVHKSAKVLKSFWKIIPRSVLRDAQGIAVVRVYKVGFQGLSARAGGGCIVARLDNDKWSPPLLLSSGGIGIGIQLGIEKINLVFILRSKSAVESFTSDSVTLGGSMGVAAGPVGRNVEASGTTAGATIFSYCQSKGLYFGIAIESSIIHLSRDNTKFYGFPKREVLQGKVGPFLWANELYEALDFSKYVFEPQQAEQTTTTTTTAQHTNGQHNESPNSNQPISYQPHIGQPQSGAYPPAQGYYPPPQGQMYPPQGYQYPPPDNQYPQPQGYQYPPQGYQYPPQGYQYPPSQPGPQPQYQATPPPYQESHTK
eukprot:TRINITY_DN3008_c0_g2_i1.p1 TRINITY_DN3008_c0_g2~~TRINITY_DN3008_c0_g2_i1.p1  ORF type:complete len:334 (-),score=82.16 TRINITY_DN3008_c0_g2_i1:105-1064(-)